MANVRVTTGHRSRVPGTTVGMQVNTFGIDRIMDGITGEMLVPILKEAVQPAYLQLLADWPVLTGASRDSAAVVVTEIGAKFARAALQIGGPQLKADPRNKSRKDYAPFVEFNGTAKTPAGTLMNAVIDNHPEMRDYIHDRVGVLVRELANGQ